LLNFKKKHNYSVVIKSKFPKKYVLKSGGVSDITGVYLLSSSFFPFWTLENSKQI